MLHSIAPLVLLLLLLSIFYSPIVDGIPSFADICELSLAPPPPAHPGKGDAKSYVAYRKQALHDQVAKRVEALAQPRIVPIERLPTWEEKQDAIDELFESIEFQLKEEEEVLGKHPQFGEWVETSLEAYLERIQQPPPERQPAKAAGGDSSGTAETGATNGPALEVPGAKTGNKKLQPGPVFIDLYDEKDGEDVVVPSIVKPIKVHHRNGVGRMVEEWQLAGHSKTKRIMLRQSTQEIAKALISHESPRVFVTGDPGVGKVRYCSKTTPCFAWFIVVAFVVIIIVVVVDTSSFVCFSQSCIFHQTLPVMTQIHANNRLLT